MIAELEGHVADGRIRAAWAVYHKIKKHVSLKVRGIIRGAILARTKELHGEEVGKNKQAAREAFEALFKKESVVCKACTNKGTMACKDCGYIAKTEGRR